VFFIFISSSIIWHSLFHSSTPPLPSCLILPPTHRPKIELNVGNSESWNERWRLQLRDVRTFWFFIVYCSLILFFEFFCSFFPLVRFLLFFIRSPPLRFLRQCRRRRCWQRSSARSRRSWRGLGRTMREQRKYWTRNTLCWTRGWRNSSITAWFAHVRFVFQFRFHDADIFFFFLLLEQRVSPMRTLREKEQGKIVNEAPSQSEVLDFLI